MRYNLLASIVAVFLVMSGILLLCGYWKIALILDILAGLIAAFLVIEAIYAYNALGNALGEWFSNMLNGK